MAQLDSLPEQPIKMLLVGHPGAGKTGALASLANAGLKLFVANFDGNVGPLLDYVRPDARARVDVEILSAALRPGRTALEYAAPPDGPQRLLRLLQDWNGAGAAASWGADSVLVIDPLSHLSEIMLDRWGALNPGAADVKGYLPMYDELLMLLRFLKGLRCHVVCITHLATPAKPIDMRLAPERAAAPMRPAPEGTDLAERSWKQFPAVAGAKLLPQIGSYFDIVLHARTEGSGRGAARVLSLVPAIDVDVKAPAHLFVPRTALPVATGLAEFFDKVLKSRLSALPPTNPLEVPK